MSRKVFTVYRSSKEGLPIQLCTLSESKALQKMREHEMNTVMVMEIDSDPAEYRAYLTVEQFEEDYG